MQCRAIRLIAIAAISFLSIVVQRGLLAETSSGQIVGSVRDASGAAVPEALLRVTNLQNQTTLTIVSGAAGEYKIRELASGFYRIVATKAGIGASPALIVTVAGSEIKTDFKLDSTDTGLSPAVAERLEAMERRMEQRFQQLQAELETKKPAEQVATAETRTPHGFLLASNSKEPDVLGLPNSGAIPTPGPMPAPQAGQKTPAPPAVPVGATPDVDNVSPFADYDWTWLNGNPRNKDVAWDSKFFTPEIRADITYSYDFNKPSDDSMGGSSELFRSDEIQLEQLGIGGDFHLDNVRARFMTQFGEYSEATIRNDPTPAKGQWNLADADRYLAEAYGGYHINWMHGMNIDAGIFMSYIGLFSYYNFDNWAYQPS